MSKPSVSPTKILKFKDNEWQEKNDLVAVEEPMEIRMEYGPNDQRKMQSISVTMRTPGNDFELAIGFLFTEGIIQSWDQIHQIRYCTEGNTIDNEFNIVRVFLAENVELDIDKLKRNFYTTSSCGVCGKESIDMVKTSCNLIKTDNPLALDPEYILSLPEILRSNQKVFEHTGGIHASALFDNDRNLVLMREDVGRHNALDKLIGAAIMQHMKLPLKDYYLLLSGRASFELIQKAAMAGIKNVCAVGAPSSLAVALAREFDIRLIGFLRTGSFNVY